MAAGVRAYYMHPMVECGSLVVVVVLVKSTTVVVLSVGWNSAPSAGLRYGSVNTLRVYLSRTISSRP